MDIFEPKPVKCGYCGEEILETQRRCPYCGSLQEKKIMNTSGDLAPTGEERLQDNGNPVRPPVYQQPPVRPAAMAYPRPGYGTMVPPAVKPMGNGLKVFLTVLFSVIPGFGQVAGIIAAIVFMNYEDSDRRSFGVALMVACLVMFFISCILAFAAALMVPVFMQVR